MRRNLLIAAGVLAGVAACHPPRSPREAAEGDLTGRWSAASAAALPGDTARLVWDLALEERRGGVVVGNGSMRGGTRADELRVVGVRGLEEIQLDLHGPRGTLRYRGSVAGANTLIGELLSEPEPVPVTFTRD